MAKNAIGNNHPAGNGGPNKGLSGGNQHPTQAPHPTNQQIAQNQAGTTYNPGVENKPIAPFWTQQDIEEYAEAKEQYKESLDALDQNYAQEQHKKESEEIEIEAGRAGENQSENWDAAGRGLFNSSIRQSDLSDIDAAAAIKDKFLSDQLSALKVYNEGQKLKEQNRFTRYQEAYNRKGTENAAEVNSTLPKWQTEPHFEHIAAPPQVTKPANQNKPGFKQNEPIGGNKIGNNQVAGGGVNNKGLLGGTTPQAPHPTNQQNKQHQQTAAAHIAGKIYG